MAKNRANLILDDLVAHKSLSDVQIPLKDAIHLVDTVKRLSGIHVDPGNRNFLQFRVNRRLRALGIDNTDQYITHLNGAEGAAERQNLVESLATHTTDFFREKAHFDFLRSTGLHELVALGAGKDWPLLVWSAACSIGSELWTAGIVLDQYARSNLGGIRWSLLGTDVSHRVVARANNALFVEQELSGLKEEFRRAYLLRSKPNVATTGDVPIFRIVPELRNKARFEWANLVDLSPGFTAMADVAFLRNVLIYFKQSQKDAAIRNVLNHLRPGGYLITGHAESLSPLPGDLVQIAPSVYRKANHET